MAMQTASYNGGRINAATEVKALLFPSQRNGAPKVRGKIEEAYRTGLVVRPPFEPSACVSACVVNTRLGLMIRKMSRNSVGLGFHFRPKKHLDATSKPIIAAGAECDRLFGAVSGRQSFVETAYQVHSDMHCTSRGYYEFERQALEGTEKSVLRIRRAYAVEIRQRADGQGFVRFRFNPKTGDVDLTHLKWFNDKRVMDATNGAIYAADDEAAVAAVRRPANELFPRTLSSVFNADVGVPHWIAARGAALANYDIEQQNKMFILNAGQYRFAVSVENGELDPESINMLKEFVRSDADIQENGGVIVLQTSRKQAVNRTNDVRIRITPLQQLSDGAFAALRRDNNDEVRESFGISGVFIGDDAAGARAGSIMRQMAIEQDFSPLAREEEHVFNRIILPAMGIETHEIVFDRPSALDHTQKSQILARLEPGRTFTYRNLHKIANHLVPGLDLAPPEAWWADLTPEQMRCILGKTEDPRGILEDIERAAVELKELGLGSPRPLEEVPPPRRLAAAS